MEQEYHFKKRVIRTILTLAKSHYTVNSVLLSPWCRPGDTGGKDPPSLWDKMIVTMVEFHSIGGHGEAGLRWAMRWGFRGWEAVQQHSV